MKQVINEFAKMTVGDDRLLNKKTTEARAAIVEWLKQEELLIEEKITQEDLAKSDFKGKINLAKDKLPNFLVENKKIYSVLSKGIHELDENECKEYFPILRSGIEIILDEVIKRNEHENKIKLIAAQINKL